MASSHPPAPSLLHGWLLGLLGVVIFALTIPMTRLAGGSVEAPQLPPAFVAFGRAAVAGVLSMGWLLVRRAAWPRGEQWRRLAVTAAGVVLGFPLFMGLAVQRVDAVHASVVSGLLPLATAAMGALLLRQRANAAFWACAVVGTGLVLAFAGWKGGARLQLADGLLALAVLSAAIGYVQGARLASGGPGASMPSEEVICWVLVMSMPITVPVAGWLWPEASAHGPAIRPQAWLAFGYLAVFSMWLGFFAWYRGLALGGMLQVSQVQLVQPFLSMWFAVPLLGESLDALTVAFSLAVMATVFVSRRIAAAGASSASSARATAPIPSQPSRPLP